MTDIVSLDNLEADVQEKILLLQHMDNVLGRIDYKFFVTQVLGLDFPQMRDPRVQWHMERVGRILKSFAQNRHSQTKYRKIMDVRPRGTCKSSGVSVPLATWMHLGDSEIACAIMSAEYEKMAKKFASAIKSTWEGNDPQSRLVELYGSFEGKGRDREWSLEKMVTSKRRNSARIDPTLAVYSIPQGPTSGHFKLFILDDPITEEIMERDSRWLEKVWAAYLRLKFVIDTDGLLYLIGTRYDDGDLIGRIVHEEIAPAVRAEDLEGAGPGEMPADFDYETGWIKYAYLAGWEVFYDQVYEDYDPKTRTGKIVYPTIWTQEKIEDVRSTTRGEALFWSNLMNLPAAREDQPLKQHHIDRLFIPSIQDIPKRALRTIDIHADLAFKNIENYISQAGDDAVMHVVAKEGGYVYRMFGWRGKVTQAMFGEELMKIVAWLYYDLDAKVRYFTYEQAVGHGSGDESTRLWLHQLMRSHPDLPRFKPFPIKRNKDKGNRDKWGRIGDTNWAWQEGYVVLVEEAPHNDPLIYQMLKQRFARNDDDADAFADSFHEGIYKKGRRDDIPEGYSQFMPGTAGWTPQPAVHGTIDHFTGRFKPRRVGARDAELVGNESGLGRMLQARRFHK